ncbi:hypothetical protein [Rhodococcus erythropolis]|uniref:hypothetical protein n=1 Tax=Rhodococcus erythropolis TaxID=1833 RepID=UPI0008CF0646|nr:hypothetical protein [Rhodococcus erythropolis]OFV78589.1 hypothetical protein RERY_07210 [Rhodococcus erythropolis]
MVEPLRMDRAKQGFDKAVGSFDKAVGGFGKFARNSSKQLIEQTSDLEDVAVGTAGKLTTKKPDPYEKAIAQYNGAFTSMNDKGLSLLRQRERSTDLIELVELLVNSVAHTPKSFETDFDEIDVHKTEVLEAEEFARKDLEAARKSAAGAGAGFTAGAAVASMAPSAALWVATTFGTASTGTAISTLSGAVATKAALAWLGGGAIAAGGGGTAAGGALLALAGPVGWSVAGATPRINRAVREEHVREPRSETRGADRGDAEHCARQGHGRSDRRPPPAHCLSS